jgi:heme exporter protein D
MMDFKSFWQSSFATTWLILKLIVPFYILAEVLFYFDLLRHIDFLFAPITELIGLPPEATPALIAGMMFNLYAAIAFAAPLELSAYQWSVLGLFLGICHSLLVETAIIKKIGVSVFYTILMRVSAGILAVFTLNLFPKSWFAGTRAAAIPKPETYASVQDMLLSSAYKAVILAVEVTILVIAVLFVLELIKSSQWLKNYQQKVSKSFSIMTGLILGITYGAGVLINESRAGHMNRTDLWFVSTFLIICHAIIEDTLLFVIFGANLWLLVIIRMIMAIGFSFIVANAIKPA